MKSLVFLILQSVVSATPAVIFTASLPLLCQRLGFPAVDSGPIYGLMRLGFLLSTISCPFIVGRFGSRTVAIWCEVISFTVQASLLLMLPSGLSLTLLGALMLLRSFAMGNLILSRFSWIRSLDGGLSGSRALVFIGILTQVSYGVAGIAILNKLISLETVDRVVLFDLCSSVVGLAFFYFTDRSKPVVRTVLGTRWDLLRGRSWLLATDICLAFALGGTNIFLVKEGPRIFGADRGYGSMLALYSVFYGLGGTLVVSHLAKRIHSLKVTMIVFLTALGGMAALAFGFEGNTLIPVLAVLFFSYALCYSFLELRWFQTATKENAAQVASTRLLAVGLSAACSEIVFTYVGSDEVIRAAFLAAAAYCVVRVNQGSQQQVD